MTSMILYLLLVVGWWYEPRSSFVVSVVAVVDMVLRGHILVHQFSHIRYYEKVDPLSWTFG
jgi:hypothetical protein